MEPSKDTPANVHDVTETNRRLRGWEMRVSRGDGHSGLFGYIKVCYRGLAKNTECLALLLGLSNLKRAKVILGLSYLR